MEQDKDLQRIYDLIEWYDFEELEESEKSFVCRHISEDEYNSMRSTLSDTKEFFSKVPAPDGSPRAIFVVGE